MMPAYDIEAIEAQLAKVELGLARRKPRRPKSTRLGETTRKLVRRQYTKDRGFLLKLGFRHAFTETSGRTTFIARPQVPVRPRRLIIYDIYEAVGELGPLRAWVVTEIKIAAKSQFVQGGDSFFPAAAFLPDASEILFKFDSCGPGNEIALTMQSINATKYPAEGQIAAGMICHAADR